jgi:DNA-binding response OmpR family regulator
VLVVEDERSIREIMTAALEDEGYEVRAAENGEIALHILDQWRPHVILLDLMMPLVNGWEFRSRQLSSAALASIPVIVMSAGQNLRAGVDELFAQAILPKPFDLDVMLSLVEAMTRAAEPHLTDLQ